MNKNCECGKPLPYHLAELGFTNHVCYCERAYKVEDGKFIENGTKLNPNRRLSEAEQERSREETGPKVELLSWDWKSSPSFEDLKRVLNPLGVHVYENPYFDGTDGHGYIFSNQELTPDQIQEAAEEEC